jgi:signal transduction histidine kinase
VRLGIRDDPEVDVVLLRVSDNGPGMSPEVIRRCVEPYFSTKPPGVSTGMGLTFVHRLVTGAGGRMDIDSTVGQGTTISLTLLRSKPAEGVELPAEADRTGSAGGSLTPPRQR